MLAGSLAVGCAGSPGPRGPEQVVFREPVGGYFSGPARVQRILDLGFPVLHNDSDHTVRIVSVELVSPGPYVRLLSATAYLWAQTGVGQTVAAYGNLSKECPHLYIPHPLSAAVTRPHSDSAWTVILALRITRPGTYHIKRVRVEYLADGQRAWQYYNMDDIVHAMPGYGPHLKGCAAGGA